MIKRQFHNLICACPARKTLLEMYTLLPSAWNVLVSLKLTSVQHPANALGLTESTWLPWVPAYVNQASHPQMVLKLIKMGFQTVKSRCTKDAIQRKRGTPMVSAEISRTVPSNAMAAKEPFSKTLESASVNQLSRLISSVISIAKKKWSRPHSQLMDCSSFTIQWRIRQRQHRKSLIC